MMKDQILEIIAKNPKHYHKLIKKDPVMNNWVEENSKINSDRYVEMIYSAVYQISNQCPNGKIRKLDRWSTGFVGCGTAKTCQCVQKSMAEKISKTKQEYSVNRHQEINQKRQETMMSKYGVGFNSQRPEVKPLISGPKIPLDVHNKLIDINWMTEEYINKQRTSVDIAHELGVYYSTVIDYCTRHGFPIRKRSNYSLVELEVQKFVESLGFEVEHSNWSILGNREIDIYIASKQLGIEINDLYWHSFNPSSNSEEKVNRHLEKTVMAGLVGVEIFHISDWEWYNQRDIIKSMLRVKLGVVDRKIMARKCRIAELSTSESKKFLQENHLQGYTASSIKLGLYYGDELVMMVTAGANRFLKDSIELHRLATKRDIIVAGGASKLIKYLRNMIKIELISYCDRSKSSGAGYLAMGFKLIRTTEPGYFWTDGSEIIPRYRTNKAKLKSWLPTYSEELSESLNMFAAGYRRFWDCGNFVFSL